jgi:hypothetical protein
LWCSTPVFVFSRRDRTNAREATENRDFALVLSASRVTPWACRVLSGHATATINSSGASDNDGFGPKRLVEPSIASILGTAATLRSTALLARNGGSWRRLTVRRGPCSCVLVRTRTRLLSVYPRGDRSRSQFFVDEGVSNGVIDSERLTSSCCGRAHGTLLVPAIVSRRTRQTPRLMTSLGNDFPLVDEEGYPYLV